MKNLKPSLKNYFAPTPKNIQKWMLGLKTILGTISTAEFFSGDPKLAFYLLLSGAIVTEFANLFAE